MRKKPLGCAARKPGDMVKDLNDHVQYEQMWKKLSS
jgi:hypothetical protein